MQEAKTEAGLTETQKQFLRIIFLFLMACVFQSSSLFSQEICDNGIDDDGDGLIDVFDPDCPCDDQILLCTPSCEFAVPGGPLNLSTLWSGSAQSPSYQSPLIADLDNDGIPEVITMASNSLVSSDPRRARDIHILNGSTGALIRTISTPFMAWVGPTPIAVADVDNDGFAEIIIASIDHPDNGPSDRRFLYCYSHLGVLEWKSDVQYGYPVVARYGSSLGIADFNSDGIAEVYVYNQIFNAVTGVKLAEGGSTNGLGIMTSQPFGDIANPAAANLTSSPGLELAAGRSVYEVTITNTSGTAGNSMNAISIPGRPDGFTALADIDLDGNIDVVVASQGSTGQLYVWNPNNGSPVLIAATTFPNTGGNWIGPPFIGDMDKDCAPEIGVTRARRVYALEYNGTQTLANKWTLITTDASGFTGITMFDFNQDGTQELVYRDENNLRIIDGSGVTPLTVGTFSCSSGTGAEMPVVADVDGDGQAEICVTCALSGLNQGPVTVFKSAAQAWAPCRKVWNQYSYFNVNINSDLTVPIQQQDHQILLSNVTCPFYTCNENRPFNAFMTQATFLTQEGCPVYPASDVAVSMFDMVCNSATEYTVSLFVTNVGSAPAPPGYPLAFYAGNPFTGAAIPLTAIGGPYETTVELTSDQSEIFVITLDINNIPKPFNLYVLLNDDGTSTPPFNFPLSAIPECNFVDNVAIDLNIDCCPFGDLAIDGFVPPLPEICTGETTEILTNASSAAGLTNATYSWQLPDNSTIESQPLTVAEGGNYTVTVTDNAFCEISQSIVVTESPLPTPSNAGADQEICDAFTTLEGNIPSVGIGEWLLLSGSGDISNPASPTTDLTNIPVGVNTFIWRITSGTACISEDTVTITRIPAPDVAVAGDDLTICSPEAFLSANIPAIGIASWSLVSGTGIIADPLDASSAVTGLSVGANVFAWTINNGVCPASIDQITITRSAEPSLSNAGPNQTICSESTNLAAINPSIGSGLWTVIEGSGVFGNPTIANTLVTGLSAGNNVFQWTVTSGACAASTDQITVIRSLPPDAANAGLGFSICSETSALNATIPSIGTGSWSVLSGSALLDDENAANSGVSNLSFGANTFLWTVSSGACPSTEAEVVIFRDQTPSPASAGPNQRICATSATMNAEIPSIGTGAWTISSGSGVVDEPSSAQTTISGLSPGTTVLNWTISNGTCPAVSSTVEILIDEPVTTANAGSDSSVCEQPFILQGNSPVVGTGSWDILSGDGTLTNPSDPNAILNFGSPGLVVVRWVIENGTCISADQVAISLDAIPDVASAGADQEICATTTNLNANTPAIGQGTWSVALGQGDFSNPNNPQDLVANLGVGINQLVWTISNGSCAASSDTVEIRVDENPLIPVAGADQQICNDQTVLQAEIPPIGTASWTLISGTADIADVLDPLTAITNLGAGSNVFRWTVVNGTCEAFDEVSVTRDLIPSLANAGADQEICATSTNLTANEPLTGTGAWSVFSGAGTFDNVNAASASVSNLANGETILLWEISNGVCPSNVDTLRITRFEQPASANAGPNQIVCGDSTLLAALNPAIGQGTWSIISGSGSIVDASNPQSAITALSTGISTLQWTVSNGVCPPVSAQVVLTVPAAPSIADAGIDQQVCTDETSLQGNAPLSGIGTWTLVTGSANFANVNDPNTALTSLGFGVNVLQWSIVNSVCPPSTDQVVIIRDSVSFEANAGIDQSFCIGTTVILNANDPFPSQGTWTVLSGSGSISDVNNPLAEVIGAAPGASVFAWTVTSGTCPPSSDTVAISISELPSQAIVGNDTSICSTVYDLIATEPLIGTGSWSILEGTGVIDNISNTNTQVSNLSPEQNAIIWQVINGACPASADTLFIQVDKNPISPNAGPDLSICSDAAILSAAAPALGTGEWTLLSGNVVFDDISNPATPVSLVAPGTSVLRWTVTNGTCIASDEMAITRFEPPSVAVVGPDQVICDSSITLFAETPLIGNGIWTVQSGGGDIIDVNDPESQAINLPVGISVFAWTVSNGACKPSTATLSITREDDVEQANAGPDLSVCSDSLILQATEPITSTGTWTVFSGSVTVEEVNNPNSLLIFQSSGPATLIWTLEPTGSCEPSSDTVVVNRDTPPSEASAGVDQIVCVNETELVANIPSVGNGFWIVASGNAILSDSTSNTTLATGLNIGNNVFEWRIVSGTCPDESDQVTIFRSDTANAGANQIICDSSTTLTAEEPLSGLGQWTVISGTGVFADSSLATTQVSGLTEGDNVFEWTIFGSGCPDSVSTVTITFRCNIPPVISNDAFEMLEDSVLTSSFLDETDFDPDGTDLVADTIPVVAPLNGTITIQADGTFTYTPNENYYGQDTVVVNVCDSGIPLPALCGLDTLVFTIQPVNDPPITVSDTVNTPLNEPVSGNLFDNGDIDVEETELVLTLEPISGPTNGEITLESDGSFTYTPNFGFNGTDTVIVEICDTGFPLPAECVNDTLFVIVGDTINTPPVVVNDTLTTQEDTPISGNFITDLDFDPDGTELTVDTSAVFGPNNGTVQINPDGSFTYTPNLNFIGIDTIVVNVCDNGIPLPEECVSDTIFIIVEPVNDPPVLIPQEYTIAPGSLLEGNIFDNGDFDPDSTALVAIEIVSGPTNGTATIDSTGAFTYTPNEGFLGNDTIIVQVCDSGEPLPPLCGNDTIFIIVTGDFPEANAGENQTICGFTTSLNANTPEPPATGLWTVILGEGILGDQTNAGTLVTNLSEGENTFVWSVTENGLTASDTVSIFVNLPASIAFAGEDQIVCSNNTELTANIPSLGTGQWSVLFGDGALSNPENPTTFVSEMAAGLNSFIWTISNGDCISADTLEVQVLGNPIADAGLDTSYCPDAQITLNADGIGTWTVLEGGAILTDENDPQTPVTGLVQGENVFLWTVGVAPCASSDTLRISLLSDQDNDCKEDEIFIPEGFSPDGDGVNDFFVIRGAEDKRVDIIVFNRWGVVVYESSPYLNTWDGTCNVNAGLVLAGTYLPESTYYYLISIEGENEQRKGYLTLWR